MLRNFIFTVFAFTALGAPAFAAPIVGQPAPLFSGKDTTGNVRDLKTFLGKTIVLEWTNDDCADVKKQYDSGNMQELQEKAAADSVIWLRVISSAPGTSGHMSADDVVRTMNDEHATANATFLDETGHIGHLYGVTVTPSMFIIDKTGILVYAGAVDSNTATTPSTLATAQNYVKTVLDDIKVGRPVSVDETQPYGCPVPYLEQDTTNTTVPLDFTGAAPKQ